jgi:hypothetical protein
LTDGKGSKLKGGGEGAMIEHHRKKLIKDGRIKAIRVSAKRVINLEN